MAGHLRTLEDMVNKWKNDKIKAPTLLSIAGPCSVLSACCRATGLSKGIVLDGGLDARSSKPGKTNLSSGTGTTGAIESDCRPASEILADGDGGIP